jgi:nucleotide-binding universal stress UspA family protein
MAWKSIVAGVNTSAEGAWAAAVGCRIAQIAGTTCMLVHAVPTDWIPPSDPIRPDTLDGLRGATVHAARERVAGALKGTVAEDAVRTLTVRPGRPARVIAQVAAELDASAVVVGAKWLRAAGHWVAGVNGNDTVRTVELPIFVATTSAATVERVLVAVDLSEAAPATIGVAHRFAEAFHAEMRVLHAVEPVPYTADMESRGTGVDELATRREDVLEQLIRPLVRQVGSELTVLHGVAEEVIRAEVRRWRPDCLVVGSHGKDWVDELLLGTLTHALLDNLPTSVLVVPTRRPAALAPVSPLP